jgi:hypothetical protein
MFQQIIKSINLVNSYIWAIPYQIKRHDEHILTKTCYSRIVCVKCGFVSDYLKIHFTFLFSYMSKQGFVH